MPEGSFAEFSDAASVRAAARSSGMRPVQIALLLGLNAVPLLHAALVAATVAFAPGSWAARIGAGAAMLYLLPPLAVRAILAGGRPHGRVAYGSRGFFQWWASFQWQVIFCRFPALEEMLRLVPGLYSLWLGLWGARIGRLTYWAAGTLILDRPFLRIGSEVVFGAGVRLNAHVLQRGAEGVPELLLAPIAIGDGASIGGYSLLTAGTEIAPGEATRAFTIAPPFSKWAGGKRVREP